MRMVLTDDPTEFSLGLSPIVMGAEPPANITGLSVGYGDDIGLPCIPNNIVWMKAPIARIEMSVGADEGSRIDMQPIAHRPSRQFPEPRVTEQNRLCRVVETQLVETFMSAS